MDNSISTSMSPSNRQTKINAINTEAERLRKIVAEAAKKGELPDFGRPYSELTDIEKQLYDIAVRRQALERRILESCGLLNERVRKVCDSSEELRGQILDTGKSPNRLEKRLSKIDKRLSDIGNKISNYKVFKSLNKGFKFLNRVFEHCLYCK